MSVNVPSPPLRELIGRSADPRVHAVVAFIETHHARNLSPDELAACVNLSTSRLRHILIHELGLSPTRLIKRIRLEQADDLVRRSFMSVKEIAAAVGFDDVSHFVRDFKQHHGETPTDRRRRLGTSWAGGGLRRFGLTPNNARAGRSG